MLCLVSALAHLDLRLRELGPVHVNRQDAGGPARRGGRIKIHRARIPDTDVVEHRGMRTATPTRTLLDVASRQPRYALFRALCEDHGIARPLVDRPVAGWEADFHWPETGLVVEVDGYEFHEGRPAFHDDRRRGGSFRRGGFEVLRFSASEVEHDEVTVAATVLAARPFLRTRAA